jgi:hypothetical protein
VINHFLKLNELFVKTSSDKDQKCIYPFYYYYFMSKVLIAQAGFTFYYFEFVTCLKVLIT